MSAEEFQLMDYWKIDDSILKRDFIKTYHQHGAEVDNENQNINFCVGWNSNCIQIEIGYFEVDEGIKRDDNTIFTMLMKLD